MNKRNLLQGPFQDLKKKNLQDYQVVKNIT
jgi:hypothetical protein